MGGKNIAYIVDVIINDCSEKFNQQLRILVSMIILKQSSLSCLNHHNRVQAFLSIGKTLKSKLSERT